MKKLVENAVQSLEKFVPSKDNANMWYQWLCGQVVCVLTGRYGRPLAEDATSEAILKVLGLSETRHLEKALEPMTLKEFCAFVMKQAEWIAGQMETKESAFRVPAFGDADSEADSAEVVNMEEKVRKTLAKMEQDPAKMSRSELETYRHYKRVQEVVIDETARRSDGRVAVDELERPRIRAAIRDFLAELFQLSHVSSDLREAFVRYVLEEESVAGVIAHVWGPCATAKAHEKYASRLYAAKNRLQILIKQKGPEVLAHYPILGEYLRDAA